MKIGDVLGGPASGIADDIQTLCRILSSALLLGNLRDLDLRASEIVNNKPVIPCDPSTGSLVQCIELNDLILKIATEYPLLSLSNEKC